MHSEGETTQRNAAAAQAPARAELDVAQLAPLAFAHAPVAIAVVTGPEQRIALVNPCFRALVGHTESELLGRSMGQVFPRAENQRWLQKLAELARAGSSWHSEKGRVEMDDQGDEGTQRVLELTCEPLRDGSGSAAGLVLVATPITERTREEELIKQSEERFRQLAEAMPQLVWTALPDGTVDYYNQRSAQFAGLAKDERGIWHWEPVVHPDDLFATEEAWRRASAEGTPYEKEHRLKRADGSFAWYVSRAEPVRDAEGRVVRWFGTATDIDALKQAKAEAEQRSMFEQLLMGIVSHDLKTPLSTISLALHGLSRPDRGLDEKALKAVMRIKRSNERAVRMVNDLLDFTQTRVGRGIPIARKSLDLHVVVQDEVEELRTMYGERSISLECSGDAHGQWDEDRMSQVVQNLVINALKYSTSDSEVRVQCLGEAEQVVLQVHNWGEPIAPERMQHLFEPLQRATDATHRNERSVGLGLYIVRHIVEAHGGFVEVSSCREQGTVFAVCFPRTLQS